MENVDTVLDIDLYQISMLRAYFNNNLHELHGAMELFARKLPQRRSFFVVAGIDRVLDYLAKIKFFEDSIKIIKSIESVNADDKFCNYLYSINFQKDIKINAMLDGEIAFANEPILTLEGPVGIIQYVEKKILSIINHDVRIASKAARVVLAARGKPVYEFGGRRAHDESSADAARSAYIAGCAGTSNVVAYAKYGIPVVGTMGHCFIMSHKTEEEAFNNWSSTFKNSTYLVDTYDYENGTLNAIKFAKNNLGAIRLDSGDLLEQSIKCKRLFSDADCFNVKIIASDDLNEYKIAKLLSQGAAIDAFGVGTEIVSTPDAPTCGFIYKLVAVKRNNDWENIAKISSDINKMTLPGRKQVWRHFMPDSVISHDVISLIDETKPQIGKPSYSYYIPILKQREIKEIDMKTSTQEARKLCGLRLSQLPDNLKLFSYKDYPITTQELPIYISDDLLEAKKDFLIKFSRSTR